MASAVTLALFSSVEAKNTVVPAGADEARSQEASGDDQLTIEKDAKLSVDGTAISWNGASTNVVIDNLGTIESTEAGGRAIEGSGKVAAPRTLTLNNMAGGLIQSQGDAFKIKNDITAGTVTVNNAGTMLSSVDGQALDFDALNSTGTSAASVTINNQFTGVITANGADAIRPGQGAVVTNAGLIYSDGVTGDKHDGVDWQGHSGKLINLDGGIISGQHHGTTSDSHVDVYNAAGGLIIGRNGSGVGSDGTGKVVNYGTITGAYIGTGNGDGDGVDIDHYGEVYNWGTIEGTGAGGVHSDGIRPNISEGVAITGGGIVVNHAGASISGIIKGLTAFGTFSITNDGSIQGGYAGISSSGAISLSNSGSITSSINAVEFMDGSTVTVTNSGVLEGPRYAILMADGDDHLIIQRGSSISGVVDAGAGMDTLSLQDGAVFDTAINFEALQVDGSAVLTGNNDMASSTIVKGARLQLGTGGTEGFVSGAITDNGMLAVDRSDTVTLPTVISGSGGLEQLGAGTTILNAANTFTGDTTVRVGTLMIGDHAHANATAPGKVTVKSGASLTGVGTMGALDVTGTLSPGDGSIGALHVTGDAAFQQGSTFTVDADPTGKADQLAAGGKVTIAGGAVMSIEQPGNWAPLTRYTIVTGAGGVSGQFDSATATLTFLTPVLSYQPNAVELSLQRNDVHFSDVAQTTNEKGAAAGLSGLGVLTDPLYSLLTLDAETARRAFNRLSGEFHASQQTARIDDSRYVRDAIDQRLRQGIANSEAGWVHAWGHEASVDGNGNAARMTDNGGGVLAGADVPLADQGRIGVAGGASHNSLRVSGRGASGHTTAHWLGAYGAYEAGAFSLRAGAAYAWEKIRADRHVGYPGFDERLSSEVSGNTATAFVEGAWRTMVAGVAVDPYVNLATVHVQTDAFSETGGSAALSAQAKRGNVQLGTLGTRAAWHLSKQLSLRGGLGWQHAFGDVTPVRTLQFVAGGTAFNEYGIPVAKNAAVARLGLDWHATSALTISAGYDGTWGDNARDNAAKLSLNAAF